MLDSHTRGAEAMDKPDGSSFAELDEGQSNDERPDWRKRFKTGAWLLGAWLLYLGILGLLSVRYPQGFDDFVTACGKGRYRKFGTGILMVGALMLIFPPFISAVNLLIGCFEAATGRPFRQIESWFNSLSWPLKCLVAPLMAAPLAILALGLIWVGAVFVKRFVGGR